MASPSDVRCHTLQPSAGRSVPPCAKSKGDRVRVRRRIAQHARRGSGGGGGALTGQNATPQTSPRPTVVSKTQEPVGCFLVFENPRARKTEARAEEKKRTQSRDVLNHYIATTAGGQSHYTLPQAIHLLEHTRTMFRQQDRRKQGPAPAVIQRYQQTTPLHKTWCKLGVVTIDFRRRARTCTIHPSIHPSTRLVSCRREHAEGGLLKLYRLILRLEGVAAPGEVLQLLRLAFGGKSSLGGTERE